MSQGTIKFFNAGKGFGFVTPDDGGADIFLPAATVTSAGISGIKTGQRVSFEQVPDTKGPKIVKLELLQQAEVKAPVPASASAGVTAYCDCSSDAVADVLRVVRQAGYQLELIDYLVTAPTPDQLRRLSHQLRESGQNLVRRFDPLFLALQLDDRFIGEQEFWTAIAEHPMLINGPVLVFSGRAGICKTPDDARAFFAGRETATVAKPKTLTPRMMAMIEGVLAPAAPVQDEVVVVEAPMRQTLVKKAAAPVPPKPAAKENPKPVAPARGKAPVKKAVAPKASKAPVKKAKKVSKK